MTTNIGSEAARNVIAFDVGGSHVSAATCSLPSHQLEPMHSASLAGITTSDAFVDLLYSLAADAGLSAAQGMSLAFPGPFDYEHGISRMRQKLTYLYGVDLRSALAVRMRVAPDRILFVHDAIAYLLGELKAGAARGAKRVVMLTLGTGFGAAFAVDGAIVMEGRGIPPGAEIYHLPFEGREAEESISTRGLRALYRKQTGREAEVAEIAALAPRNKDAATVFAQFGNTLGRAIKVLLSEFAPDTVVLGGGIARSPQLFLPAAEGELTGTGIALRITELDTRAPLIGAAAAWERAFPES